MSNMNTDNHIAHALAAIGGNEQLRAKFLELCREAEEALAAPDLSVRDEITGPVIDALHEGAGILRKTLDSGLVFDFHYRSKIAREIVMSPDTVPDHLWEPQTTRLLVHLADGARNVVIGGAYAGDQAILVADTLRASGGTCHAFEPNDDQREMLKRNAMNNDLSNIRYNASGLWKDEAARMTLVGDDSFAHPELTDDESDADSFPTTSINAYGAANGIDALDLIMLDIEGAELAALQGADTYLAQPEATAPSIVFEVHRHYVDWSNGLENAEIVRLLTDHGYQVFAVRDFNANVPMNGAPVELVRPENTYLEGPPHGFNMLAVKRADILDSPFFTTCENVSPKLLWHKSPALHHPLHAA